MRVVEERFVCRSVVDVRGTRPLVARPVMLGRLALAQEELGLLDPRHGDLRMLIEILMDDVVPHLGAPMTNRLGSGTCPIVLGRC